jgi:hypothetical protein
VRGSVQANNGRYCAVEQNELLHRPSVSRTPCRSSEPASVTERISVSARRARMERDNVPQRPCAVMYNHSHNQKKLFGDIIFS